VGQGSCPPTESPFLALFRRDPSCGGVRQASRPNADLKIDCSSDGGRLGRDADIDAQKSESNTNGGHDYLFMSPT